MLRWGFVLLVLQRQLGRSGRLILVEGFEDSLPDARAAPSLIPAVDRLPGTEVRRQLAPRRSGACHPEHAREHGALVVRGTTYGRLLGREQWHDASPPCIGQLRRGGSQDLDREQARRVGLVARPARRVAASGVRLVPTAKGRPSEAEIVAFGCLGERQQQAADFRHGERNQVGSPPFCPAVAWSRVTSR